MCNVCGAINLMDGEILETTAPNGDAYEIKATAEAAELAPCQYSLRKNSGEWIKEIESKDLAGVVWEGGFDRHSESLDKSTFDWLENHFISN